MYGRYRQIKTDLFDIAKRLKEIDKDYFVVYSYKKHRYEIHCSGQRPFTFCLAVPYPVLDARTIALAQKTRRERAAEAIAIMERENLSLIKKQAAEAAKKAEYETEKILRLT